MLAIFEALRNKASNSSKEMVLGFEIGHCHMKTSEMKFIFTRLDRSISVCQVIMPLIL